MSPTRRRWSAARNPARSLRRNETDENDELDRISVDSLHGCGDDAAYETWPREDGGGAGPPLKPLRLARYFRGACCIPRGAGKLSTGPDRAERQEAARFPGVSAFSGVMRDA